VRKSANPKNAQWLQDQIRHIVKVYTPLAEQDLELKDLAANGRGFGYEQLVGILRGILEGIPAAEFKWDPKYDIVRRARK